VLLLVHELFNKSNTRNMGDEHGTDAGVEESKHELYQRESKAWGMMAQAPWSPLLLIFL
jgi:hypothetical protein